MKFSLFFHFLFFISVGIIFISLFYPYAYFKKLDFLFTPIFSFLFNPYISIIDYLQILLFIPLIYPYLAILYLVPHYSYFYFFYKKNKPYKATYTLFIFFESYYPFLINLFIYISYYFRPFQKTFFKIIGIFIITLNIILTYHFFTKKVKSNSLSSYLYNKYLLYSIHFLFYFSMMSVLLYIYADTINKGFGIVCMGYIFICISFLYKKN